MLIEAKADVNTVDNVGSRPVHGAAWGETPEILELLIEAGADIKAVDGEGDSVKDIIGKLGKQARETFAHLVDRL